MNKSIAWIIIICLAITAFYDLYRVFRGQKTVSNIYHSLFPSVVNKVIMVTLTVLIWWKFSEQVVAWVMLGETFGHLLWFDRS